MNLRNGQITLGEILQNPQAKALLSREFPQFMSGMMLSMGRNMSLNQILGFAGQGNIPRSKIDRVLSELKAL